MKWINFNCLIVKITFQYTRIFNYVFTIYNCYYIIKYKNNFTANLKYLKYLFYLLLITVYVKRINIITT